MQQQSQTLAPPPSQRLVSEPPGVVSPQPPACPAPPPGTAVVDNPVLAGLVQSVHGIHR